LIDVKSGVFQYM